MSRRKPRKDFGRKAPLEVTAPAVQTLRREPMPVPWTRAWDHVPPAAREAARLAMDAFTGAATPYGGHADFVEHGRRLGVSVDMTFFMGYPLLAQLSQNGLIRACITAPALDMTRNGFEIVRDGEADGTDADYVRSLELAFKAFGVERLLRDAATYTGYFGGCFLFVDTGVRGPALADPLAVTDWSGELGKGRLRGFRLIDPADACYGAFNSVRPLDPDYFRPEVWHVQGQTVHRSRLIKVSGALPPRLLQPSYNFLGIPQAQVIADHVLHFAANNRQAAELLGNFASKVAKLNLSQMLTGGDAAQIARRVEYMVASQRNSGVLAIDKDTEDFVKQDTSLAGVPDIVRQSLELVCAVNGTPVTKTLGLSPAGFNATGEHDMKNYYDRVSALQEEQLAPALERVLRIVQLHVHGRIDRGVTCRFLPLSEEDRKLEAEIRKIDAETNQILVTNGVVGPDEWRRNVTSDPKSGYDDEDPDREIEPPAPAGGGLGAWAAVPGVGNA
jgi:phage-related protein (TIGR01555 family)